MWAIGRPRGVQFCLSRISAEQCEDDEPPHEPGREPAPSLLPGAALHPRTLLDSALRPKKKKNFFAVDRGGPGCLRNKSASLSRTSAGVMLPCGVAAG